MPRPLRVLIDARMLLGRFSGVARVVTRLVDTLARCDDLRIVALCGDEAYAPWSNRTDIDIVISDFSRRDRSPLRRLLWEETRLRGWVRRAGADLFHATWNQGIPARCPVPGLLTIHDLIPWQEPQTHFSGRLQFAFYRHAIRASARRAVQTTTVSRFTRNQVLQRLHAEPDRVSVVPNGVDAPSVLVDLDAVPKPPHPALPPQGGEEWGAGRPIAPLSGPYVLYVGGHEDRKNVETVLNAMESYWARFDASLELHLTGRPESLSARSAEVYRHVLRTNDDAPIRFLGTPDDNELARQYAAAGALLLLSRAEGFGLPALEAMAHGCPVIAARAGALPEVVDTAGLLVDPGSPESVADAIHNVLVSSHLRRRLARDGRGRAAFFSWERSADAYRRIYHALGHNRATSASPAQRPAVLIPR